MDHADPLVSIAELQESGICARLTTMTQSTCGADKTGKSFSMSCISNA
jgi:hypothetical protein